MSEIEGSEDQQEFGIGSTAKLDRTFGFREGETATVSAVKGLGEGNDGKKAYDITLADGSSFSGARYDNGFFTKRVD